MKIVGYTDQISLAPGNPLSVYVSSEADRYTAEVVRLIHGDLNPAGPGFKTEPVETTVAGEYPGEFQPLLTGSYSRSPARPPVVAGDFTLQMWIWATTPDAQRQTLISQQGGAEAAFALRLEDGHVTLEVGTESLSIPRPVQPRTWYFVAARYEAATGKADLVLEPTSSQVTLGLAGRAEGTMRCSAGVEPAEVLIAAEHVALPSEVVGNFYNGKIDAPKIFDRALTDADLRALSSGAGDVPKGAVAAWDFSQGIDTWIAKDVSGGGADGALVNQPTRGMTGHNWTGSELAWPHAPEQYGAIHFHDDDLSDAGWDRAFEWKVPDRLKSGVYAIHLKSGEDEDYVPFVVTPGPGRASSSVAVLLPTFTYLAYANERMHAPGGLRAGRNPAYPEHQEDEYIVENELRSMYDNHRDGSGVCYASWLRPLMNMRPRYNMPVLDQGRGAPHGLNADLHLIDWLEQQGHVVDVLTDVELHRQGSELLSTYRVVISGSHNEYWSGEMLEAMQAYLHDGGRFMSLCGNGMYWVTQLNGTSIEIRRAGPAQRVWGCEPGEDYLSSTGEPGGLWRHRGQSPQSWIGAGFTAEGNGPGRPYQRQPDSFDPRAKFVFEGVDADELIGDFPNLVMSWGAAGYEIDRAAPELGTPDHTLILASATGFDGFVTAIEEMLLTGGSSVPEIQCDMTLLEYPHGGAVFATGSITWCGSLSYNNYDNNVSRITANVLAAFNTPGELPVRGIDDQDAVVGGSSLFGEYERTDL